MAAVRCRALMNYDTVKVVDFVVLLTAITLRRFTLLHSNLLVQVPVHEVFQIKRSWVADISRDFPAENVEALNCNDENTRCMRHR